MNLKGSKTEKNLKDAFAGESQANRRYLYFAAKADVEGFNDVSTVFRSTAEGETGHAHGHLEYLEAVGDPATGLPIGETKLNLKAAIAAAGGDFNDVVKLNYYSVDLLHLPDIREVRDKFINTRNPPASTAVEVRRLARPEFLIEVEAVVVVK